MSSPKRDVDVINRAYSKHIVAWTSHLVRPTQKQFPSQPGWIKINFDVAIRPHVTITDTIRRNEFGDILFANSNLFPPTLRETQDAFQAIKIVVYHKYSYVLFKGDSKGVIETLQNINSSPPWFLASFLPNVKVALSSLFCWDFSFVSKDVNFFPHNQAHWATF